MPGTRLAAHSRMLIRRCVWHREYHGYPILYGVASWRGWRPRFSDGLCRRCARTARSQWDIPIAERPRRRRARFDAVTISTSVLLLLVAARSLDDQDAVRLLSRDARTPLPAVSSETETGATPPPATSGMASPASTPRKPESVQRVASDPATAQPAITPVRPLTARPLRQVAVAKRAADESDVGRTTRARPVGVPDTVHRRDDRGGRSFARASAAHDDITDRLRLAQAP